MADTDRNQAHSVGASPVEAIREDPYRFDFFRAVRLIETHFPQFPRVGESLSPEKDAVRFGQQPDLAFPTSSLESVESPHHSGRPSRLNVRFLGLLGPNGPLPAHLTEFSRDRQRNARDTTLVGFFNIFHHRLISLFYRAWAVNQKAVDFDRPSDSRFGKYFGVFFGFSHAASAAKREVSGPAKLFFTGRLSAQTRNAEGLQAILGHYFRVPARVQSFVGHWLPIPGMSRARLGVPTRPVKLGEDSVIGARFWSTQTRVGIHLGPMTFARYQDFLPTARSFARVCEWMTEYTGQQFHWFLRLRLLADEVPMATLGGGSLLGWTTWLKSAPFPRDAEDFQVDMSETRSERMPRNRL
jgi:type VI secretion system protein ImpH